MTLQSSYDSVERQIADHFGAAAAQAPLSDGFWPRLRARMSFSDTMPSLWRRVLQRPRLAASAAAVVLVALVGTVGLSLAGVGNGVPLVGARNLVSGSSESDASSRASSDSAIYSGIRAADGDDTSPTLLIPLSSEGQFYGAPDVGTTLPTPTDTVTPSPAPSTALTQIETAGRSVISSSSVTVEVDTISGAMSQLRAIAESVGGFIESMSTSGGEDPSRGNATVRIPGAVFFDTIERIKVLGTTTSEQVTSDDVTEQVIDLEARLRSERAKEVSFIELLDRANSVSDVLTVERELSRVRTEIERLQGRLGFIERRVNLATIHVTFTKPAELFAEPPAASMSIETRDVEAKVARVRSLVLAAGGEIDSTSTSLRNDGTQAFMVFRVPTAEFDQMMANLETIGDVKAKEVRQPGTAGDAPAAEEPDARVDLTLVTPPPASFNWWLWVGAPLGAAAAIAAVAIGAYRMGRRPADRA